MENEVKRLFELLKTLDPKTVEYRAVLDSIRVMCDIRPVLADILAEPVAKTKKTTKKEEPKKEEPKEEPKVEEAPKEEPKTEEPELTQEYVRDLLTKAAESGVKIKDIIAKFVPEGEKPKFSLVPASNYKAIVEELSIYAI